MAAKSKITVEINFNNILSLAYLIIIISTFNIINEILLFLHFSSGVYFIFTSNLNSE